MARTVGNFLLGLGLLTVLGCESKTPTDQAPEASASREQLLMATDAVVEGLLSDFLLSSQALQTSVQNWQSDSTKLPEAKAAFHNTMDVWQRLEVLQLGPLAAMGASPGGDDRRDLIYSWPLVNACRVDQATANSEFEDLSSAVVNLRGLDVLEYLLFVEGATNACPVNSTLNSSGQWAALGEAEVTSRRAQFAASVAADLVANAQQTQTAYQGFSAGFVSGKAPFSSQREAMNALTHALFYVEKEVKDMKLAPPIGASGCATTTCPELAESRFGGRSLRNVRLNLEIFRTIFVADETTGFDALLVEAGGPQTAADMLAEIDAALAILNALERDFPEALEQDQAQLELLFQHVRSLSTLLKTEFITLLDLDLPSKAEGDND